MERDSERLSCESRLCDFIARAWRWVEPATEYVPGWHIRAISDHLEAVTRGEIRKLLINIPPRCMKSLQTSVFWPAWTWTTKPSTRWLYGSYSQALTIRDALKTRRLLDSAWYRERWGQVFSLTGDQNAKSRYDNDKGGYRIAAACGGGTGEGGDILVIDDPHNITEAESEVIRKSVIDWYDQVWLLRRNDPKTSAMVMIMQRVHAGDLAGHVLDQGGWTHLCLPMEYDGRRCVTTIGGVPEDRERRKEEGELLWPERVSNKELPEMKRVLGPYGASGQLQQLPAPKGGGLIKSAWFRFYSMLPMGHLMPRGDGEVNVDPWSLFRFATVDLATSLKTSADYCVFAFWGWAAAVRRLYLLDLVRDRLEGDDKMDLLDRKRKEWRCALVFIESVQFQLDFVQRARRRGLPARELEAEGDKIARALSSTALFAGGQVWFPDGAPWYPEYAAELTTFPNAEHDDQVDVTSYAAILCQSPAFAALSTAGNATGGRPKAADDDDVTGPERRPVKRGPLDGFAPGSARLGDFYPGRA
jgi:predicted phage terminase large subunit-like protein